MKKNIYIHTSMKYPLNNVFNFKVVEEKLEKRKKYYI